MNSMIEWSDLHGSQYNNGALAALQLARLKCEETLHNLVSSFGRFLDYESLTMEQFMTLPSYVHHSSLEDGSQNNVLYSY